MTLRTLPRAATKPQLLKAEEVAEITRVPPKTLHNWANASDHGLRSHGPRHIKLSAKRRVWALEDVLDWIEQKRDK